MTSKLASLPSLESQGSPDQLLVILIDCGLIFFKSEVYLSLVFCTKVVVLLFLTLLIFKKITVLRGNATHLDLLQKGMLRINLQQD